MSWRVFRLKDVAQSQYGRMDLGSTSLKKILRGMSKNSLAPHDVLFLMTALFHIRFLLFKVNKANAGIFFRNLMHIKTVGGMGGGRKIIRELSY